MLVERVLGVFRLDSNVFEEIEHDPDATVQAAIIVGIAAFLGAWGSAFSAIIRDGSFFGSFISSFAWSFVSWFLWSAVTYYVGTSLFKGVATLDEMLRVIGFAYAPRMLGIVPCLGGFVGWIWSLIAGFIAVRQGLDLDDTNACLTIIVGFVLIVAGSAILSIVAGGFLWLI